MRTLGFASIIVTYRCNARCHMCNTWKYPSKKEEELSPSAYEKLPTMSTVNVTGGEPFMREDLGDIISVLRKKAGRLVISSNGFFSERIIALFKKRRDIGIRISIEGLPRANDELRGIRDGFDRGLRTLLELHEMGVRDIGFGITASDRNAKDIIELFYLARRMGLEFATAAVHNSFYFHKYDNRFVDPKVLTAEFAKIIARLLRSRRAKDWFRAYFNYGLINYIEGRPRLLPCEMGTDSFFLDPWGRILPCNVLEESMGSLREKSFDYIWNGKRAEEVRQMVRDCKKNCWMIGSVAGQMKKNIWVPAVWIFKNKFLRMGNLFI
jgi:MoaA/NifB/PqqE/SkfB family radical SAM enzyme